MTASVSADAVAESVLRLRAAGCVFAEDEVAVLAQAIADQTAADLTSDAGLNGDGALAALVDRRALGEPLEQVVGYADFCGVRVRLRPGVFVPRVRSQLLVRLGVAAARRTPHPTVVDLCCGSGALGLAVKDQLDTGAYAVNLFAADLDPVAVACAQDNLGRNVYQGDLFEALPAELQGRITVLLANVPYVATRHIPYLPAEAKDHEPHTALNGGTDGLDVFGAVVSAAPQWLAPGGVVLCEITEAQADRALALMQQAGLTAEVTYDDDLEARVITGQR